MANARHKIRINGILFSITLADVYTNGADYNIGTVLDIEKLADNEALPPNTPPLDIGSGLKNGLLARLAIRYKGPNAGDRSKTSRIVCPIDKAPQAIAGLVNKNYAGGKVSAVSIPQRRRLT